MRMGRSHPWTGLQGDRPCRAVAAWVGAALSAVVVFGLFISAPETQVRYGTPQMLWLVAIGLIYWLARLWVKTSRGEMHDDPVVYAIKDRGSRVAIFGMIAVMLAAHFLTLGPSALKTFLIAIISIALSVAAQFSLKAGMSGDGVNLPRPTLYPQDPFRCAHGQVCRRRLSAVWARGGCLAGRAVQVGCEQGVSLGRDGICVYCRHRISGG